MPKSYYEKLKDPRWQKKRLEIMERDGFSCVDCEDKKSQLQVHHEYYESGKNPWEYPSPAYLTVCSKCHIKRKKESEAFMALLHELMYRCYFDRSSLFVLFNTMKEITDAYEYDMRDLLDDTTKLINKHILEMPDRT